MFHRIVFPISIILTIPLASCANLGSPVPPTATVPATATSQPTSEPLPSPTPEPATATPAEVGAPSEPIRRVSSPDGRWTAIVDEAAGSLALEGPDGATSVILPEGSTVGAVAWSPDGKILLVERTNWLPPLDDQAQASGPPEIWAVRVAEGSAQPTALLFRPDAEEVEEQALGGLAEVVFGRWAPDGRHIFLWIGASGSIRADGNAPWVLDAATGDTVRPADWAVVNPRYYSWAPDGSALAITAGGGRSAQVNKWLNIVDIDSGEVTTVISDTEQVPGIVAWSSAENSATGDRIAYAAVPTERTGKAHASLMTFENPAIAARRIYLLDPGTGEYRRLNDVEGYQDAPVWSRDGEQLYYVQRDPETETLVLMVADPETGEAQPIEASRRPAPPDTRVGYYGQAEWDDLLGYVPDEASWEPGPDDGTGEPPSSPTPDTVATVIVARESDVIESHSSPDGRWRVNVVAYPCDTEAASVEEEKKLEQLVLVDKQAGTKTLIQSQVLTCGSALGAAGLGGLFWSPDSQIFYYTDAREGVPDGGGGLCWDRPLWRLHVDDGKAEHHADVWARSRSGDRLAMAWDGDEIIVETLGGERISSAPLPPNLEVCEITWSAGEEAFVYLRTQDPFQPNTWELVCVDADTGASDVAFELEDTAWMSMTWESPTAIILSGIRDSQRETWTVERPCAAFQ